MNRTKIEWVKNDDRSQGFTWNPWVGCDHHETGVCAVGKNCYALKQKTERKMHDCPECQTFTPHLHPERMNQPIRRLTPSTIFAVSVGDLMSKTVPREVIIDVIRVVIRSPQHRFLFLTKNPDRYREFVWPSNCWLGVTVNIQRDACRLNRLALTVMKKHKQTNPTFASFEPLYEKIDLTGFYTPDWIIIGGQTNPEVFPEWSWVMGLVDTCNGLPLIYLKDNIKFDRTKIWKVTKQIPWIDEVK
jgi:protein gp37